MAKKYKNFTKNVSSWSTFSIYDIMPVLKMNNQCQYDIFKFQFYFMLTQLEVKLAMRTTGIDKLVLNILPHNFFWGIKVVTLWVVSVKSEETY